MDGDPADIGQCERNPNCVRGFRHLGRGGKCSSNVQKCLLPGSDSQGARPAAMAPGARCAAPFMLLGMGGKQPDVPRTVGEAKAAFQEAYGKPVTTLAQSFVSEMLTAVTLATAVPSYKYSRVFAVGFEALCDSFLSSIPNEAQRNELRDCMCTALELDGNQLKTDANALTAEAGGMTEADLLASAEFKELAVRPSLAPL